MTQTDPAASIGLLITVSATYGSGGSVIAPALAQRLGVPCLRRLTTTAGEFADVAEFRERLAPEEARATPVHGLLASLSHALPAGPTQSPPPPHLHHQDVRRLAEAEIHELADTGAGVILGRGAAVVLSRKRGFHVRLDGPPALRVEQGARIEGISVQESAVHMRAADKARTDYVRRLYGLDPSDPALYHLIIDSTAIPLDTAVEVILSAATAAAAR